MAEHLKRRGGNYYVRIPVPKHLWAAVGKREVVRTTGAGDLREARRRRHAIAADIHAEIDRVAKADPGQIAWLEQQAQALRRSVQRGELDEELASDLIGQLRDQHLRARDKSEESNFTPAELSRLQSLHRVASQPNFTPLSELIKRYLEEKSGSVRESTVDAKRRVLEQFTNWLETDPDINTVDRRTAADFVSEVIGPMQVSLKTKKDTVSTLSAFFNYAIRKARYAGANPFAGLAADLKGSTRGGAAPEKRAWTKDELVKLFRELPAGGKYQLRELAALLLYTGARRDEIASLRIEDIDFAHEDGAVLHIREGKSRAAVRDVPVHPKVLPVLKQLIGKRTEGQLFANYRPAGRDKKLGHEVSKRHAYWVRQHMPEIVLTLPSGRTYAVADLHSYRRAFITALEVAGVPERTAQQLVGHTRGLAYGTYSKGVGIKLLREAVGKVDFEGVEFR